MANVSHICGVCIIADKAEEGKRKRQEVLLVRRHLHTILNIATTTHTHTYNIYIYLYLYVQFVNSGILTNGIRAKIVIDGLSILIC